MTTIDLDTLTLAKGGHQPDDGAMCVMEAVALLAGEEWTDHPQCASPVISAFLRTWNDNLPDDDRQQLKRYIPRVLNSRGTEDQEVERSWLATDWLVRVQAPEWLRLAGLTDQADTLASMQPINSDTSPSILPALKAVYSDAAGVRDAACDAAWDAACDAAGAAAGDAAWDAACDAAGHAAWDAAGAAAGDAAWDAACDAAGHAAWDAAWHAAWDAAWAAVRAAAGAAACDAAWDAAGHAAWDAAWAAAGDAAWAALQPTVDELQPSAHQLVDRLLAVTGN